MRSSIPKVAMLVLLLVLDKGLRRRLAEACRDASPGVECIESDDDIEAVFSVALHRLDLVVLDGALLQRYGARWLANWRRMIPRGGLLVLQGSPEGDILALREAIAAASDRRGGSAQSDSNRQERSTTDCRKDPT